MAERHLTFAEVQRILGLTPDEIRELMESRDLHGDIIDGVIQFRESEVAHLGGPGGEAPPDETGRDMGLVFLVDKEEEEKIEGRAYDGEELLIREEATPPAPDEEIMEPVDLSDEQRRNAELLGAEGVVEFGREVSERTREEEFGAAQLAEGEKILDPSEVELPEPEFGTLAAAVPDAAREEPHSEEPVSAAEDATVEQASPEEVESETVEFVLGSEPEPGATGGGEEKLTFIEEEAVAGAASEEAEAAAAEETPVPEVAEPVEAGLTFEEEEEAELADMPAEEELEETPAAEAPAEETAEEPVAEEVPAVETPAEETAEEPVAEAPAEETAEEPVVEKVPAAEAPVVEKVPAVETPAEETAEEPVAEEAVTEEAGEPSAPGEEPETFVVSAPEPVAPVTGEFELAVDEESADLEPEGVDAERVAAPEEAPVAEQPAEPEDVDAEGVAAAEEAPVAASEEEAATEETGLEAAPAVEEPAAAAAAMAAGAAATAFEEPEQQPTIEEPVSEEMPLEPVTVEEDELEEPAVTDSETPREVGVETIPEEAEQVTDERKEGEEQPEEELIPLSEEGEVVKEPEEEFVAPILEEGAEAGQPVEEAPAEVPGEPAPGETFEVAGAEEPKAVEEPTPVEEFAPVEEIEVTDIEEAGAPAEGEEELVVLEEEAPAGAPEAAPAIAKDQTLEEEMAELFGEGAAEASPDEAFTTPAGEEDFDLSVFKQQEEEVEEAIPTEDESLFEEVGEEEAAGVEEHPTEEAAAGVQGVSRIRALTEERAAPSTFAVTAAVLLAFAAVAFAGMLLWRIFNTG